MKAKRGITEEEFLAQVVALARLYHWRVAHFRPARTARGWRTPCQFDAAGFPDLILARGHQLGVGRVIAAELKVGRNALTNAQSAWLTHFLAAGIEAYVWRPGLWDEIVETLSDG